MFCEKCLVVTVRNDSRTSQQRTKNYTNTRLIWFPTKNTQHFNTIVMITYLLPVTTQQQNIHIFYPSFVHKRNILLYIAYQCAWNARRFVHIYCCNQCRWTLYESMIAATSFIKMLQVWAKDHINSDTHYRVRNIAHSNNLDNHLISLLLYPQQLQLQGKFHSVEIRFMCSSCVVFKIFCCGENMLNILFILCTILGYTTLKETFINDLNEK